MFDLCLALTTYQRNKALYVQLARLNDGMAELTAQYKAGLIEWPVYEEHLEEFKQDIAVVEAEIVADF